jgi:ribonucleoside-diphosphate reductase alpha chain
MTTGLTTPIDRPDTLPSLTVRRRVAWGGDTTNIYVTVSFLDNQPIEVFSTVGKTGQESSTSGEAVCRVISLYLRSGGPVTEVIKQLRGIGGQPVVGGPGKASASMFDAIALAMEEAVKLWAARQSP